MKTEAILRNGQKKKFKDILLEDIFLYFFYNACLQLFLTTKKMLYLKCSKFSFKSRQPI